MNTSYIIDYQGVKLGHHHYTMPFGADLFDISADGEVTDGSGVVEIDMERGERMLELNVTIEGSVNLQCDRCADDYVQKVEYSDTLIVKISDQADEFKDEQDGSIMWIGPNERLDLKRWIYESVILSLPIMRVHLNREDCNAEVLKYIKTEEN